MGYQYLLTIHPDSFSKDNCFHAQDLVKFHPSLMFVPNVHVRNKQYQENTKYSKPCKG